MSYAYCLFLAPPVEDLGFRPGELEISRLIAALDARGWLARPIPGAGYSIDAERVPLDAMELGPWIAAGVRADALLIELDGASAAQTRAIVRGEEPPPHPSGAALSAPLEPRECGAARIMILPRLARLPLNSVSGERMSCPRCGGEITYEAGGHSTFFEAAGVWPAAEACPACGAKLESAHLHSYTADALSGRMIRVRSPFFRFALALYAMPGLIKAVDLPDTHAELPRLIHEITGMRFRQLHQYW